MKFKCSRYRKFIALQSETCDPLLKAAEQGLKTYADVEVSPTLAEGIAIGKPMRAEEILDYVRKFGIRFIHAREDRILEAREKLAKKDVYSEHTTFIKQ